VGKAIVVITIVVKTHSRRRELKPKPVEPASVRRLPLEHACSHCQPNLGSCSSPPLSSFWVEVENSSKLVAPSDLSTP
jgi:hypothetical protein